MRGFINRIFKLLNIGGRDWVVFLLALLLAFSTWIIHNLSLKYSVYLKVQVFAESNIEGCEQKSISGSEIMARCRTTGWRILYHRIIDDGIVEVAFLLQSSSMRAATRISSLPTSSMNMQTSFSVRMFLWSIL